MGPAGGFGLLSGHLIGLPRLLGLAPAQALRVLWLAGFRTTLSGSGSEVVAQVPGWGLGGAGTVAPTPHPRRVQLTVGRRIVPPTPPPLPAGAPAGVLAAGLRFVGGPALITRPLIAGAINVFSAGGRLIAQVRTRARHRATLRLRPGVYLLNTDADGIVDCGAVGARVRAGEMTRVTVGSGCDVP